MLKPDDIPFLFLTSNDSRSICLTMLPQTPNLNKSFQCLLQMLIAKCRRLIAGCSQLFSRHTLNHKGIALLGHI